MSNHSRAQDEEQTGQARMSEEDLEALGLTPVALQAAIGRAKIKAQRKQRVARGRAKLNTNPELDKWFD